jgi:hypothetical protein
VKFSTPLSSVSAPVGAGHTTREQKGSFYFAEAKECVAAYDLLLKGGKGVALLSMARDAQSKTIHDCRDMQLTSSHPAPSAFFETKGALLLLPVT